tara:strand:+ start:2798 stop:2977 length:180 start_codon:yes stop_codon:yes gene_type:complete
MRKMSYLEYSCDLNGFNYYLRGKIIYRFELYLRNISVSSIENGTAHQITRKKRPKEYSY